VLDLGEPILCAGYDLAEGLRRENAARMAREDGIGCSDDDELEIEEADS
jgi:hypothetical protein